MQLNPARSFRVCGRRGAATTCLMPRFSSSLAKALLPRQVTYWLPLSVRISSGLPCDVSAARSTSSTDADDWLACNP